MKMQRSQVAIKLSEPARTRMFFFLAWSWYETYVYTSFFSSYSRGVTGWQYAMGNFALLAQPLVDDVELTVQRENTSVTDTFKVCSPHTIRLSTYYYSFSSFHIAQDLDQAQRTLPTLHHIEPTTV